MFCFVWVYTVASHRKGRTGLGLGENKVLRRIIVPKEEGAKEMTEKNAQ
jgi:hypothetical protein